MRPEILFILFASVSNLPHVGPKTAKLLERLCGPRTGCVLASAPQMEQRHALDSLYEAQDKMLGTLVVSVGTPHPPHPPPALPRRVMILLAA